VLAALAAGLGGVIGCSGAAPMPVGPRPPPPAAGATAPLALLAATPPLALAAGWRRGTTTADAVPAASVCRESRGATELQLPGDPTAAFDTAIQVRIAAGGEETAGLRFRRQSPTRYYLARLNSRINNVRLYRVEDGHAALLAGRDLAVPVGQWHTLRVRTAAEQVTVELDGEAVLVVADAAWGDGGLALWAAPETAACFATPGTPHSLERSRTNSLQE
jgi:hypothetical protein